MKKAISILGAGLLVGSCGPMAGIGSSGPLSSSGASSNEPAIGYILFVGDIDGRRNLYKQEMDGMTPVGAPIKVYNQDLDPAEGDGDARYPKITEDGRYFIFVTRKSTGVGGLILDQIQLYDHTGQEVNAVASGLERRDGVVCKTFNYPEILAYEPTLVPAVPDMLITFTCADDWGSRETITATIGTSYLSYFSQGTGGPPAGEGYLTGFEQLPPTEFAVFPGYTATDGGLIAVAHENTLRISELIHNQPGDDYIATNSVYANPGQHREAGHCKGSPTIPAPGGGTMPCLIPAPTALRDGYAPSIASDGAYLMYNAESFDNDPQRGEELFVIDLPPGNARTAYAPVQFNILGYQSTINLMPHVNDSREHYGRFARGGLHQYVLYTKTGDGLWVAPDLNANPVAVPLPSGMKAIDAAWFYKES